METGDLHKGEMLNISGIIKEVLQIHTQKSKLNFVTDFAFLQNSRFSSHLSGSQGK